MAKIWGHVLNSAVAGYERGMRIREQMDEAKRKKDLAEALKGAAKPEGVTEGGTDLDELLKANDAFGTAAPADSGPSAADLGQAAASGIASAAGGVEQGARSAAAAYGELQKNYRKQGAAANAAVGEEAAQARERSDAEVAALASEAPAIEMSAPAPAQSAPRMGANVSAALASMEQQAPPVGPQAETVATPVSSAEVTPQELPPASQPGAAQAPMSAALAAQQPASAPTAYSEPPRNYNVGGKSYQSRDEAEAAAKAYNSPAATAARMGNVYMQHGQPEKSLALNEASRQSVAQEMAQADAAWKRRLGRGMVRGLQGMVDVLNETGGELLGGQKAQLIPGADGKTFTLGTTGPDGNVSPVPGFPPLTNSFEDLSRAAVLLDHTTKPETRMELFTNDRKVAAAEAEKVRLAARDNARDAATAARSDRDYALNREKFEETKRNNEATLNAKSKPPEAKPLPSAALKMQQESLDAIGTASSINADLAAIDKQIADGKLTFGPVSNLVNAGLNAAGSSTESSRNFASFKANMEKLRNDSLRLNKGVQTDGDAQRAWNELFQSINDTKVVQQRLKEIQGLNERAVQLRRLDIDNVRANYGHPPLDTTSYSNQPAVVGGGRNAGPAAPGAVPQVRDKASFDALPSGALFIGPEGGPPRRKP